MSRFGVHQRLSAQRGQCRKDRQVTEIEGKKGWRDKKDATCGASCGWDCGIFPGGTVLPRVARFRNYRVNSKRQRVALRSARPL